MSVYFVNFTAYERGNLSKIHFRGTFYTEHHVPTIEHANEMHNSIISGIHNAAPETKDCFIEYTLTKL